LAVTDGYGHSLYSAAVVNHLVTEYIGLLTDQKTMKETLLQQRIVAIKDKLEFRLEIVDSQQAATSVHNVFKDKTLVAKILHNNSNNSRMPRWLNNALAEIWQQISLLMQLSSVLMHSSSRCISNIRTRS